MMIDDTQPHRIPSKLKYRMTGVILSVLFMALFLGALGLRIWASGKATETVGPSHVAVDWDRVYVDVNGELFVLSTQGFEVERKKIAALLPGGNLIDLHVLRDGRLLLATQRPAGIELCDPAGWSCDPVGRRALTGIRAQIKVLMDKPSGQFFITDSTANRLWRLPLAGGALKSLTAAGVLRSPNDIAMGPGGRLWIADSGNHRLVEVAPNGDGEWKVSRTLDARNRLTRLERDWPTMLAMDSDGNWWVTQSTNHGGDGDLLVYRPGRGVVARIALPKDAHPTDVARLGAAMLVTDMDRFVIYKVDIATCKVGEFGDASFRGVMREAAARKARYQGFIHVSLFAMIGAGVLMLLAAFWASPKGKRFTPVPHAARLAASGAPEPTLTEVHWLNRNPGTERTLRLLKLSIYVTPVFLFASVCGLYLMGMAHVAAGTAPEKLKVLADLKSLLFLVAFLGIGVPILGSISLGALQRRLGTDGNRLFVKLRNGRKLTLAPEQLVYSTRLIAYQRYTIPIQMGNGQPLYDDGEIETYIAPLLARSKRLGPWEMYRYLLVQREPVSVATLVFTIFILAMIIATGAWRLILPGTH